MNEIAYKIKSAPQGIKKRLCNDYNCQNKEF